MIERRPRRRRRRALKAAAWLVLATAVAAIAMIARPAAHLLRAMASDRDERVAPPPGMVDDASRLNATRVAAIIDVAIEGADPAAQIADLLERARREGLRVSIAGARHTMGGHTIHPGGLVLNMRPLNRMDLDARRDLLHVQAGATWDEVIAYLDERGRSVGVMQSNSSFTVGGSISVNCHGWQHGEPPIASTVESFRIVLADGTPRRCSRTENAELFSLSLGGYGLFGVILDVELRVVPNERYSIERRVVTGRDLAASLSTLASDDPEVGMAQARLDVAPDTMFREGILTLFRRAPADGGGIPAMEPTNLVALKRAAFRGSAGSEYGKRLRWRMEKMLGQNPGLRHVSRNQLLHEGVEVYGDRSRHSTDVLHEYFVPPERFAEFLGRARSIVPHHHADLLNATVRHVLADDDTFLRYADREMLSIVMLFHQSLTPEADAAMERLTRELVDAALASGGRHYLPYRLHATPEQVRAAYPQIDRFFAMKLEYDPQELFQNRFYARYGVGLAEASLLDE